MSGSVYRETGICVEYYLPHMPVTHVGGATAAPYYLGRLEQELTHYTHVLQADGGFWSCQFTLTGNQKLIEDWINEGLGRHVVVYSPHMSVLWEGFVNNVSANLGSLQITRGELVNLCNYAMVEYVPILDATASPPICGTSTFTTVAYDNPSLAKFGTFRRVLSVGPAQDADALQARDLYVMDSKYPETQHIIQTAEVSAPTATITCLGYYHLLSTYWYYYHPPTAAQVTVNAKLQAVLVAHPDSIYSTDYHDMQSNATLVQDASFGYTSALEIVRGLVALGDASNHRWLFGVGVNRRAYFRPVPVVGEYEYALHEQRQGVVYIGGRYLDAWDVQPGKWCFISDWSNSKPITDSNLRRDARYLFAEQVTYTAPHGLQIDGGRVNRLGQKLARLGLGSVGADEPPGSPIMPILPPHDEPPQIPPPGGTW